MAVVRGGATREEWTAPGGIQSTSDFSYIRTRYRLKLDAPAPAGGYKIPLRIAQIYKTYNSQTHQWEVVASPAGVPLFVDMMLECAADQSEGIPVEIPDLPNLDVGQILIRIPACVTTEDVTITPPAVPDNGTCVVSTENFNVNFGNEYPVGLDGMKIYWYKRRLNGSGAFDDWSQMYDPFALPATELIPLEGSHKTLRGEHPGIYQLEARLHLPDGREINYPFVRMRNARSIVDSTNSTNELLKAGKPDFFGVVRDQISLDIRNKAVTWLGATGYRKLDNPIKVDPDSFFNINTRNSNKCTLFVTHLSRSLGATTPFWYRWYAFGAYPYAPLARQDWYSNPGEHIHLEQYGWKYGNSESGIEPGQIIAAEEPGHDSGHAGILDYDGTWIGAGPFNVNKYISLENMEPKYRPFTIRHR